MDSLDSKIDKVAEEVVKLKEDNASCKVNELRDRLMQSYRYYTSPKSNPSGAWNEMEADTFWRLFSDYEKRGGDGYMHSTVQPAMNALTVVKLSDSI